ncbi:MAG TPA: histidine kinase [Flavitalea sp.]|nr:histidine kinase [Flavitalea sp.]
MRTLTNMMRIPVALPQYTGSDRSIFLRTMPLGVILLNWVLLGNYYFSDLSAFLTATVLTCLVSTGLWLAITWMAVTIRQRFPHDKELVTRVAVFIPLMVLITWLSITIIFQVFDLWIIPKEYINETRYYWSLIVSAVLNIFITLLHEGISGFEKWKETLIETEQLKKEYMQSQLLGLKSQVNPHFLFNSLNSLSCLIYDDPEKAEKFLDEMSKVYRYLLRSNEEQLVSLDTELQFARSYFYLLKERHGDGVSFQTNIRESDMQRFLPPLTLQILLENAFQLNMISRENPLTVEISSLENGWLQVKNNIQKKLVDDSGIVAGVENIRNKYRLLCRQSVVIRETPSGRTIQIPLLDNAEIRQQ